MVFSGIWYTLCETVVSDSVQVMSGWLTHEVKVAFSTQTVSEKANHFVQLHAAVDDGCHGNQGAHVGVHLLVHQPEGQRLIPN